MTSTHTIFLDKVFFKNLSDKFLKDQLPDESKVLDKIRRLVRIDENQIYLPVIDINNIINFSIYTEREQLKNIILESREIKIGKISNLLTENKSDIEYKGIEQKYKLEELCYFVYDLSKKYGFEITEKNNYLVITTN